MPAETLLEVRNLRRIFHPKSGEQEILRGIDLKIRKGDFTVIMGASGSGKSTLLYAISGMDRPTSGQILFNGTDMTGLSTDKLALFRRDHCGFVFQQMCLVDSLNVIDNIMVNGLLSGRPRKEIYGEAVELLRSVNIEEHTYRKFPSQISGGTAQRVGIVRALINRPEILFADEPTGALNSQNGQEVLNIFSRVNAEGQSIIMVTHDLRSALRGNRILYLQDGRILDELILPRYQGEDDERRAQLGAFLEKMGW